MFTGTRRRVHDKAGAICLRYKNECIDTFIYGGSDRMAECQCVSTLGTALEGGWKRGILESADWVCQDLVNMWKKNWIDVQGGIYG